MKSYDLLKLVVITLVASDNYAELFNVPTIPRRMTLQNFTNYQHDHRREKREELNKKIFPLEEANYFLSTEKKKNSELQANLEDALSKIQLKEREIMESKAIAQHLNRTFWIYDKNMSNAGREVTEKFVDQNATKFIFEEGLLEKRFTVRRYFQMAWRSLELYGSTLQSGELTTSFQSNDHTVDWGQSVKAVGKTFWDQGATLVSSLDTLYIMECPSEFQKAKDWLKSAFSLTAQNSKVVFHVRKSVILYIGGFLSTYALTGDTFFRDKAIEMGEYLLPAFEIGGGYSCAWYHINDGCMLLEDEEKDFEPSAYASLNLEFELLSDVSGNEIFREKAKRILKAAKSYPQKLQSWFRNSVVMDNLKMSPGYDWSLRPIFQSGGTYLDYLLKAWIRGGRKNDILRETYIKATEQAIQDLIMTSKGGLAYVTAILVDGSIPETMAHSTCYVGGNLALGGYALGEPFKSNHSLLGEAIANTCHEAYIRSPAKLAADLFDFSSDGAPEGRVSAKLIDKGYEYHPQAIETYFILWRLTHNPKYRQWGSEILDRILVKYHTYNDVYIMVGTSNVLNPDIGITKLENNNRRQPSYLLAETLKYLYLLFGDDNVFPLDQWVFNTNGHPLPVKGTPRYQHINNNPTTFHSLTVKEIKEGDIIKRIQPPRRPVPNKRTLDSLIRQKLAVRNLATNFWRNFTNQWENKSKIPTAQWSNARENEEFWGADTFRIASLDALFIMGMAKEYKESKDKVVKNFNKREEANLLYVKKTMISHVGGLLSCYSLTGDGIFRENAIQVTRNILTAYNTTSGLPYSWFNLNISNGITNVDEDILESSAFASLFIELDHLSHVTKLSNYQELNRQILKKAIDKNYRPTSMFRNAIPMDFFTSSLWPKLIAESGGTYVEYLLKSWILGGRKDNSLRESFITTSEQVIQDLVRTSRTGKLTFVGVMVDNKRQYYSMAHSTCFLGGLLALGGAALGDPYKSKYMKIGENITITCQEFYNKSTLGVAPTLFDFSELEPKASNLVSKGYQFTSEAVESLFIMYRLTYDQKYRNWGWDIFDAINKMHNSESKSYEGILDTTLRDLNFDGRAPGIYFLTETLKYLYLLFSDEDEFSLDEFVFNANGHPLPIKGLFNYP